MIKSPKGALWRATVSLPLILLLAGVAFLIFVISRPVQWTLTFLQLMIEGCAAWARGLHRYVFGEDPPKKKTGFFPM